MMDLLNHHHNNSQRVMSRLAALNKLQFDYGIYISERAYNKVNCIYLFIETCVCIYRLPLLLIRVYLRSAYSNVSSVDFIGIY